MKKIIIIVLLFFIADFPLFAQEKNYDFDNMTRKEILQIDYDEMLEMPFGDLKKMASAIGVSTNELLNMALNREVSSASKKGESVFESPLSTTVITKEEIRLTGATSYEELFRLVPGMIVRQESNGNYDIHIRGNDNLPPGNFSHFSENMMTLVMVDGRIVYNYINGGTFWESIPVGLADIERIEIIRGASSALYGPNAVSGVINIITKKPRQQGQQLHGDLQAGNYNTYIGSFSFQNRLNEKTGIKISGAYDFRDRFQDDFYQYITNSYVGADSVTSMFSYKPEVNDFNPNLARKTYNGNAGIFYDPNAEVSMDLNAGWQSSKAQSMFFENLATPFGIRETETSYINYKTNAYGFKVQANYLKGRQNLHKDMFKPVIEYDMDVFNATLEYDLVLNDLGVGELSIRPGVNYQMAAYDDKKYVKKIDTVPPLNKGLLNGKKELETYSGSMRIDYKPTSDLRLIAALRADRYNVPDDIYFSWQFITAYSINSKHLVRATYSRANRGSFIGNAYSNFKNPLIVDQPMGNRTLTYYQYYMGSEEADDESELLTQDLYEIGYRGIVSDYLQIDLEGFYSHSENFDLLLPKTMDIQAASASDQINIHDKWFYQNVDLQSDQIGATIGVNVQPLDNLILKVFGTVQQTNLKNILKDISRLYDTTGAIAVTIPYEDLSDNAFENKENKWTPTYYGGLMLNYTPVSKLNLNLSAYYYGEQIYSRYYYEASTSTHTKVEAKQDPNVLLNAKFAYRITDNSSIFINARNLLDHSQTEIPYNDKIRGLYLVGIDFSF